MIRVSHCVQMCSRKREHVQISLRLPSTSHSLKTVCVPSCSHIRLLADVHVFCVLMMQILFRDAAEPAVPWCIYFYTVSCPPPLVEILYQQINWAHCGTHILILFSTRTKHDSLDSQSLINFIGAQLSPLGTVCTPHCVFECSEAGAGSRRNWMRWTWVHEEEHGPRCASFVGIFTPSAHRHTGHFPAAGSRQARERKPDNVFRKQCNSELAPKLGSDQRNYGQDLSETGPHLARLRMFARSLDPQEIQGKRENAGDLTVQCQRTTKYSSTVPDPKLGCSWQMRGTLS